MNRESQQQAIDWRSLPKAASAIDETYKLAHLMLRRMQQVSFHRLEWGTFGATLCVYDCGEGEDEEKAQLRAEEERLRKIREDAAQELDQLRESLEPLKRELKAKYEPIVELLDYSLPSTLGNVAIDEKTISGRFAFFFFYPLSVQVEHWAIKYAMILRTKGSFHLMSKIRTLLEDANESFPFADEIHSTLFIRLNAERSQILRDLPAYQALRVPPKSKTRSKFDDPDHAMWEKVFREYQNFKKPDGFSAKKRIPGVTIKFQALWKSRKDLQAWNVKTAFKLTEAARKRIEERSK